MGKALAAITTMEGALGAAEKTLEHLFNPKLDADKQIPIDLIHKAKGIAFMTVIKAGFVWTGRIGTGVVLAKLPDGRWSAPSAIGTAGVGFGAEAGGEMIEFMIILNSDDAVKNFMRRGQASAGVNIELAAGPYGRAAGANASISRTGVAPNYTYSHSMGLFGGVGLQGSAIAARADINKKFYGREITPTEILSGQVEPPSAANGLYNAINCAFAIAPSGKSVVETAKQVFDGIPATAIGPDAELVYDRVMNSVHAMKRNDQDVTVFKVQCKVYGQNQVAHHEFNEYLLASFTKEQLVHLLPDLVKLLQDHDKRKNVWNVYESVKIEVSTAKSSASTMNSSPSETLF